MVLAIEPPRGAFYLAFQESVGVDPHMLRLSRLEGQFQSIAVLAFNFLSALQFNLSPFSCVVDQRSIQIGLRCYRFHLVGGERFYFVPIQERAHLPTMRAVKDLDGGLAAEVNFQT